MSYSEVSILHDRQPVPQDQAQVSQFSYLTVIFSFVQGIHGETDGHFCFWSLYKSHSLGTQSSVLICSFILPQWAHWVLIQIDTIQATQAGFPMGMQVKVFSGKFMRHSKSDVELNGLLTDETPNMTLLNTMTIKNASNISATLLAWCYTGMSCVIKVSVMDIKFTSQQE